MRPILALNCLLQTEQERSEEESSVGDALALAFRCACFCSASLILFASYSPAPLLMRPCQPSTQSVKGTKGKQPGSLHVMVSHAFCCNLETIWVAPHNGVTIHKVCRLLEE